MPPPDSENETITLRGDADKLGNALTLVYERVSEHVVDLWNTLSKILNLLDNSLISVVEL